MNNLPVIDLVFVILIVLMLIRGYTRGFVGEFFPWATMILAIWTAVFLYPGGAAFIRTKTMENVQYLPEIIAFLAVFFIVTLLLKMVEHVLRDVVAGAKLGGLNKFLGAVFGIIEGVTITALVIFVLSIQPVFDASNIIVNSIFAQVLLPIIKIPFEKGIEAGSDFINTAMHTMPETFSRFFGA